MTWNWLKKTFVSISIPISWTGYLKMATYFTDTEIEGLNSELVSKLDTARRIAGIPFLITSGLRTCAGNQAVLGVEGSAHIKGLAVDLATDSSEHRFAMVKGLLAAGFTRIGIYDHHCHADVDAEKPQNVIWIGISH